MITRAQGTRLLTLAATFDNRGIGEAAATAWADAGTRARWTYDEAAEAIKDYYATTTDDKPWIMPSHVTARIRAARQDQAMRETARELTGGPPHPRSAAIVAELAAKFEIPEPRSALRVPCPFCHATPGTPCTRPAPGGPKRTTTHPSRVEAADAAPKATR
jgi:hypothetical protein